ncbi:helix-turn-helix domain-containing protein [Amycolatopsis vastitatis]|nr:hypothetical protein [Amycolatopsis vastitatis]
MFELVEPIATVAFSAVATEAFLVLGMRNYRDGYFAGRAAPLGQAPAEVARHLPWVWGKTTPEEAIAVRERGSATALRQRIGKLADSPGLPRVADLATRAAVSAPTEGRALRGLVDATGGFTDAGRETSERIEALTDELAAPAYAVLGADELDELVAGLEPIAAAVQAAHDRAGSRRSEQLRVSGPFPG